MAPVEGPKLLGFGGVIRRILIGAGLVLGVGAGAIAVQSVYQHKNLLATVANDFPMIPSPQNEFHRDHIALLVLGIDYSYTANDIESSTNARSDTIKAVSLTFPTAANPNGKVAILSVPRDMDYVYPNGHEDKINSAYGGFNNDSAAAAHSSERAVASFLGVPGFDKYLTLRIDATKELIDAIGGIDVTPDETMNYDDSWGHLHIHFIGGKRIHMNGEQAVSYSRFRHDACSDPCRIKRQDTVIRTAIAKLKNDKFNDLLHINQLIGVVRRNVYTDLSDQDLLSLAWAFQHIDPSKLDTEQVPYVGDKELSCCGDVVVADDVAKAALVKKMFPIDTPQIDPQAVAQINPATIHVEIENGSGVKGQGALLAEQLRKKGYMIESIGNAASFAYDATEIHVHSTSTPLAGESVRAALALKTATVRPDVPSANVTPSSDVTVIVGRDFVPETAALGPVNEAAAQK